MSHRLIRSLAATAVAALTIVGSGACTAAEDSAIAPTAVAASHDHAAVAGGPSITNRQLAGLRAATSAYHDIERAKADQWNVPVTPCWYNAAGAMGYHYADVTRIDGTVDSLRPEALMYEPMQNGRMRLVGVEYIVPIDAWTGEGRPSLFGRDFDRNDALGLYVLHVWAWRDNPAGIHAGWNRKVSCAYAAEREERP